MKRTVITWTRANSGIPRPASVGSAEYTGSYPLGLRAYRPIANAGPDEPQEEHVFTAVCLDDKDLVSTLWRTWRDAFSLSRIEVIDRNTAMVISTINE